MKNIFLILFLTIAWGSISYAGQPIMHGDTVSAWSAGSITDALATHNPCKAVWIGTTQSVDFSFDGTSWVTFQGATAGTVLPIQAVGARITSGSAAPAAGDIVFLY